MNNEEFLELVKKSEEKGFRKCYIKKVDCTLMFKDNIYFNMIGIYEYKKWKFNLLAKIDDKEKVKKYILGE